MLDEGDVRYLDRALNWPRWQWMAAWRAGGELSTSAFPSAPSKSPTQNGTPEADETMEGGFH